MKILRTERAMEPCAENGYVGYYFYLDSALDDAVVQSLAPMGTLTYLQSLKKPFFLLRGSGYVLRGQLGDDFCKVGIAGNDAELLQQAKLVLEQGEE